MSDGSRPEEGPPIRNRTQRLLREILSRIGGRSAQLAGILGETSEALIAFDAHRNILHANARAEALFGYPPGALERQSTDALIPERLRRPDAPPMRVTDDLMYVELPGLMRDGTERIIEWCFGSVRVDEEPLFVMTVRDRVELDRALEALRVSDERFHLLVNGVQDHAIFMLDTDGRVSSWNTGAARIKGWSAREILGQPYELFFTPEDRAAGVPGKVIAEALQVGSREVIGWRVRKDGSRFWAHGSLTALRDAEGHVRGFAKITRDLTERRQAEEIERRLIVERAAREAAQEAEQRLRTSEDRLRRLQQMTAALSEAATPEEVSTVVLGGGVDALGAAGVMLYVVAAGGNELELLGRRGYPASFQSYRHVPLDAPLPITDVARSRAPAFYESRASYERDYPELRDAVAAGNFEATAILPLVSRGGLVGMLIIRFAHQRAFEEGERTLLLTLSDLCSQALERARLFSAERMARANAESANRSKDEFLAMLGHELRNPLAPIVTAVQLMKLHGDPRSAHEREVIERQTAHLSRLVDDLLDVSRVARGLVALSRVTIELADVLSNAVEMASPLIEQRAQHLTATVPKTGLSMNADPLRVAQVVANLLANAAKYTPLGGNVWLDAGREGAEVVIRVRDNGEGITPDLLPNVFNLFVQGAQTVARSGGGLGLGLALVKSFVTLHGGTVTASSAGPGHGSEFTVRLPALSVVAETATPAVVPAAAVVAARGKRILVVDDNDDARELLAEFLQELGHEVQVAPDGPVALELLRTFAAEVAILDLGLPVMDGFELARRLRELPLAGAAIRLIAVTGYGQERDVALSRAAGFDVHLVKPVDIAVLVAALEARPASPRAPHGSDRPPVEI